MQDRITHLPRRAFLGKVTITLGGLTLAGTLPVSLLQAAPAACLVDASRYADPCGDWQLDDVFTAYPPYSLHPAPAMPAASPVSGRVDAIDRNWVS